MKKLILLAWWLSALLVSSAPPNIVLIISDDMGVSDLGCYGGEIETPNLDALADGGIRFTNYYVHNMCWPTRASLMTGLYPRTALPAKGSASGGLHPKATTLPQALRDGGYTTLMSGKWHLSNAGQPDGPNAPHRRGFDQFYGIIHGACDFFAPADLQLNGASRKEEWDGKDDYIFTDALTDRALKFLNERPKEKPFFLYLAYTAAHWPLHAWPKDIERYKGRYAKGWDALREERFARMKELGIIQPDCKLSPRNPTVPAWEDAEHKEWQQRRMEVYAAQVTSMDENIGRVIQQLKASGEFDNTLILYQHDNGGCHVEYTTKRKGSWTRERTTDGKNLPIKSGNIPGLMPGPQSTFQSYGYGWANASNTPYRLFKQHDHQGGILSPLIVSWPAGIPEKLNGTLQPEVCHVIDMMPSLLEAAGLPAVEQKPLAMEGRSFASLFKGQPCSSHEALFWAHAKGRAVRTGDWKLVRVNKKDWELYNLAEDEAELNNLADQYPEKVKAMIKLHQQWEQRTK